MPETVSSEADRPRRQAPGAGASRPFGITALSIFFTLGAAMALAAAVSLLLPETPLEFMWRLNPRARAGLRDLGFWAIALMLVVSAGCAASALGLWRGTRWGHAVALGMLAVHLVGDALNVLLGVEPRAVVGVPIVGALIAYLLTRRVRRYFARAKAVP